ncbi:hypothetical protein BRD18_00510 [Halobacteriales archaeon SW_7_71_33]|nr:MAG: hypothetical protein BRD18_00510 [Halobacteriales archaeon SW_7_71_33]
MVLQLPLSPLSLLFLLSAGLLLATAAMTFVAGGTPEVRRWLLALMMADATWALTSVLQLEAASESVAFAATAVWLVTSGAAATLWFLFAVVYTGREPLVTRRRLAVLVAPLVVHVVAFATNPLHGASVSGFTASTRPVTTVVGFSYGPVYATATLYALLLTVVGTALVAETALRDPELYADPGRRATRRRRCRSPRYVTATPCCGPTCSPPARWWRARVDRSPSSRWRRAFSSSTGSGRSSTRTRRPGNCCRLRDWSAGSSSPSSRRRRRRSTRRARRQFGRTTGRSWRRWRPTSTTAGRTPVGP